MAQPFDIVAYTYKADIWCGDCVIERLTKMRPPLSIPEDAVPLPNNERILTILARERNIDREDERTYDSDDFPKVIFRDQVEDIERCCSCGEEIG